MKEQQINILPFNREVWMAEGDEFRQEVDRIMEARPVMNLTEDEVITTLRLMEIQNALSEGRYNQVVVHKNDARLELCKDDDKFLAMLADCDKREVLLFTGRCRSLFGGTVYHWRNIAHKCPIISVASAISEFGTGYYGRGWVIAPHICRLRDYILNTSTYSRIQKLKE